MSSMDKFQHSGPSHTRECNAKRASAGEYGGSSLFRDSYRIDFAACCFARGAYGLLPIRFMGQLAADVFPLGIYGQVIAVVWYLPTARSNRRTKVAFAIICHATESKLPWCSTGSVTVDQ